MLIFLSAVPAPVTVQITLGGIATDCFTWIVSNSYSSITSKLLRIVCVAMLFNIPVFLNHWWLVTQMNTNDKLNS